MRVDLLPISFVAEDRNDYITIYTATSIQNHPDLRLTHGGLLLVALVCGGDYNQVCCRGISKKPRLILSKIGLSGCDGNIAHGLAQYGLGDSLLSAAKRLSLPELANFLYGWRDAVRFELTHDTQGFVGQKYPAQAKAVPSSWPDPVIVRLYARPLITSSVVDLLAAASEWKPRPLDVEKLASLCISILGWEPGPSVVNAFRRHIWAGLCIRRLCIVRTLFHCFLRPVCFDIPFQPLDLYQYLYDYAVVGRVLEEDEPSLGAFLGIEQVRADPAPSTLR